MCEIITINDKRFEVRKDLKPGDYPCHKCWFANEEECPMDPKDGQPLCDNMSKNTGGVYVYFRKILTM